MSLVWLRWACSIGTTQSGSDISSGTSSLSNTVFGTALGYWTIDESAFAVSGSLSAGTYWLTLTGASDSNGQDIYWDKNNGPSEAFQNGGPNTSSESFQLYGNSTAAPVPSTLVMSSILLGHVRVGVWGRTGGSRQPRRQQTTVGPARRRVTISGRSPPLFSGESLRLGYVR